jgi:lysophospholipid acyltransferase (LPLAT)-like uncharacterized protein
MIETKYKIAIKLLNLLSKTWSYKVEGKLPGKTGVIAFWHANMLPVWKYFSQYNPYAVVSMSKDGDKLSAILKSWGYKLIRGSSSKGSHDTLVEIIEKAPENLVLITPDGPRGPAMQFKPGAVIAAQRSNTSLYLCKVEIRRKYNFKKSWDKFVFPLIFSKIKITLLPPISIGNDIGRNDINRLLEECKEKLSIN